MKIPKEKKDFLINKSSIFCLSPFMGNKHYFNYFSPCLSEYRDHHFVEENDLRIHDANEIINKEKYNKLRLAMIHNDVSSKELDRCKMCNMFNAAGARCSREWSNYYYEDIFDDIMDNINEDGSLKDPNLIFYVHLSYTNTCNYKCRYCEPERSSALTNEFKALKKDMNYVVDRNKKEFFKNELFDKWKQKLLTTRLIHFTCSGEALLTQENIDVMKFLIDNNKTDVHLLYNTNLSVRYFNNTDIFNLWSKFKKVIVLVSAEGLDPYHQIIKGSPNKFSTVEENIKTLRAMPNITLNVHATYGAHNFLHLPKFHKYLYDKKLIKANEFYLNPLFQDPESVQIYPLYMKKKAEAVYLNHINWLNSIKDEEHIVNFYFNKSSGEYKNAINFMYLNDKTHLISSYIKSYEEIDNFRKTDSFVLEELKMLRSASR